MLFWTQKIKDHSKKKTRAYKEQDEEKRVDYERAMSVYKNPPPFLSLSDAIQYAFLK
ncbi:MAG: hypothetical protein LBF42_04090 [Puniceicoccales bacterium]|jgi:hypothetical protein|nr:hypothetical protein [Puniceicoccales bacterium]